MFCALVCGAQTVNVNQIRPSTTNTQVITTVGGATVWAPGGIPSAQGTAPIQVNGASGVPATGAITVSCPTCGGAGLVSQVSVPVNGTQTTNINATSFTVNSVSPVTVTGSNTSAQIQLANCAAGGTTPPPCGPGDTESIITWTGFALPAGITSSNFVGAQAYLDSTQFSGSGANPIVSCFVPGSTAASFPFSVPKSGSFSQLIQVAGFSSGITAAQIPSVMCTAQIGVVDFSGPVVYNVDQINLIVTYTGSPLPNPTSISVAPPLTLNSANNTLGFNPVYNYGVSGGSADAYTLELPALVASLSSTNLPPQIGQEISFTPNFQNATTTPTLNLNGSGPITIIKANGAAVAAGDIGSNCNPGSESGPFCIATVKFDGNNYQLQNPQTSTGGGSTVTLTGPVTGSGTGTIATTITPTGVSAGSFTNANITVNAAGQVTAASNGSGGSGSISVNGASVSSPNLNGTTPAAPSGSTNCTWAVSGSSVSCSVPNGGSASLPSAAAPGQIIASTAAGTTYAPVGNVFYSQSGDTVASIEAECSSPCTYVVTQPQTITLTASHTLNANVNLLFYADGIWTINGSTFTLSIPTQVAGTLTQHFVIGSGLLSLGITQNSSNPLIPVEWFGAKGDFNGSTGTDNTVSIQNALNSLFSGQVLLQHGQYEINGALSITRDGIGIAGTRYGYDNGGSDSSGNQLVSSAIIQASASADTIDCTGPGGGTAIQDYIVWNKFNDFDLNRLTTATGTAAGLSLSFCAGAVVDRVISQDSVRDFYFHSVPAFGIGVVENSEAVWGFEGVGLPSTVYGFYLDSADGNAENSLRMFHDTADTNDNSGSTSNGIFITGSHINDVMVDGFETDEVSVGISVNSVSPAQNFSDGDIHFWHCINDSFFTSAIQINNVVAASGANVDIEGGWAESVFATGPAIDIESSNAVKVIGMQIGSTTDTNQTIGVLANNSSDIVISNNTFRKAATAFVELENTNDSTVTGNSMASLTSLTQDILVTGTSSWNVISGNSIAGTATTGVIFGSSTTNNTMLDSTAIDTTSITTAFTNAGTSNTIGVSSGGGAVSSVFGRTAAVTANTGDYTVAQVTGAAPLASPTFTGIPAAPTAAASTNTTQLATTAFVTAALAAAGSAAGIVTYSGPSLTFTGTAFFPIGGGGLSSTTETNVDLATPATATVKNFTVQLSVAPGTGNSIAFTWRDNATSTAITCTVSGSATSCSDLTHSFTASAGDLLDIQAVTAGTILSASTAVMGTQVGIASSGGSGFQPSSLPLPPALSGFTPLNLSPATAATVSGVLTISYPGVSTNPGPLLNLETQTNAFSAPYSIAAAFSAALASGTVPSGSNINSSEAGLYLTDGTKFEGIRCLIQADAQGGTQLQIIQWNNSTSPVTALNSASFITSSQASTTPCTAGIMYVRWRYDGTNLFADISPDGVVWNNFYNESPRTFLSTPTAYGWGSNWESSASNGSAFGMKTVLAGWLPTNSATQ